MCSKLQLKVTALGKVSKPWHPFTVRTGNFQGQVRMVAYTVRCWEVRKPQRNSKYSRKIQESYALPLVFGSAGVGSMPCRESKEQDSVIEVGKLTASKLTCPQNEP